MDIYSLMLLCSVLASFPAAEAFRLHARRAVEHHSGSKHAAEMIGKPILENMHGAFSRNWVCVAELGALPRASCRGELRAGPGPGLGTARRPARNSAAIGRYFESARGNPIHMQFRRGLRGVAFARRRQRGGEEDSASPPPATAPSAAAAAESPTGAARPQAPTSIRTRKAPKQGKKSAVRKRRVRSEAQLAGPDGERHVMEKHDMEEEEEDEGVPFLEDFLASDPPFAPESSATEDDQDDDASSSRSSLGGGNAGKKGGASDPWAAPHLYRQMLSDAKNKTKIVEMYTPDAVYKGGRFGHQPRQSRASSSSEADRGDEDSEWGRSIYETLSPPPQEGATNSSSEEGGEEEGDISDATIDWLRENFSQGPVQRMASTARLVITAAISTPAAAVDDDGLPLKGVARAEGGPSLKTKYGCCPLDIVNKVFDYLKNGTNNDPRISYSIMNCILDNGEIIPDLHDSIQMWAQGYNTYHLIDGHAMRSLHGGIRPEIILNEASLRALLDQVCWALAEDEIGGGLLSPRQRRIRLRGGPLEFTDGYNTEGEHLYESLSVINY